MTIKRLLRRCEGKPTRVEIEDNGKKKIESLDSSWEVRTVVFTVNGKRVKQGRIACRPVK